MINRAIGGNTYLLVLKNFVIHLTYIHFASFGVVGGH